MGFLILLYYFHYTAKPSWVRLLSRSMKLLPPKGSIFYCLFTHATETHNCIFCIELNNRTSYTCRHIMSMEGIYPMCGTLISFNIL